MQGPLQSTQARRIPRDAVLYLCVQQRFGLDGARGVDLLNAVCIMNTLSDAAGLGQTSSRHSSHPERRWRGSWVSTRGLCFLCLGVRSWENRGLFQLACGPEEACTVSNQWHVGKCRVEVLPSQSGGAPTAEWRCSHIRVEVLPPLGFGAERKPMLSAPPFPCAPALTLSISPPPSAPVTPPLGN